ncbi:MAG: cell division protein SepF [Lachnospiraceae bacterium]
MGVFDKFLNIMKLDDEDDFDEYDEYDEDDDEYEEAPKKSLFPKKKEKDFDYELEEHNEKESRSASKQAPVKITPLRNRKSSSSGLEVCVIKPGSFEDARDITDTLISGRAVVLNLEGLDVDVAQRIIDYACGTCCAIEGNLQKISNYIFIVTPKSVDISGDLQDILTNNFEVPNIKTDF